MFSECFIIAFIVFKKNEQFAEYIFFTFLPDPAGIESQPY